MSTTIVRGNIRIAVETFGQAVNPHVVLISGAGAPAKFWPEDFCRTLVDSGLFVVRYSHRDTGASTHFDEAYPLEELLLDLLAVIEHFDARSTHLVGHSMGGYLAQMAGCRQPELASSITSISAGSTVEPAAMKQLGMTGPKEDVWPILMANQPCGDFERDLPGWLDVWRYLNASRSFDPSLAEAYTGELYLGDDRNWQVATNHVHAMTTVPVSLVDEIAELTAPLLVLHGTEDPLVPMDNGEATARLAGEGRIHRLAGAGHMFFGSETWDEIAGLVAAHSRC